MGAINISIKTVQYIRPLFAPLRYGALHPHLLVWQPGTAAIRHFVQCGALGLVSIKFYFGFVKCIFFLTFIGLIKKNFAFILWLFAIVKIKNILKQLRCE